jgi:hypothetical protein
MGTVGGGKKDIGVQEKAIHGLCPRWRFMRDARRVDTQPANLFQGGSVILRADGVIQQELRNALGAIVLNLIGICG